MRFHALLLPSIPTQWFCIHNRTKQIILDKFCVLKSTKNKLFQTSMNLPSKQRQEESKHSLKPPNHSYCCIFTNCETGRFYVIIAGIYIAIIILYSTMNSLFWNLLTRTLSTCSAVKTMAIRTGIKVTCLWHWIMSPTCTESTTYLCHLHAL